MTVSEKLKKILRRTFRILIITLGVVLGIVILIIFLIQTRPVQNYGRGKLEAFLQKKLNTKVRIGEIYIGFPSKIIVRNIYLEDQRKDTLLYGGRIEVGIGLFQLLNKEIRVSNLELDRITMNISRRQPDSVYNFQFIADAFGPDTTQAKKPADTTEGYRFDIGTIQLHDIYATYRDDASGNDLAVRLGDFKTDLKTFDPAHQHYSIPTISLSNIDGHIRQYHPILILKKLADTVRVHNETSSPVQLDLGSIDFNGIRLNYHNDVQQMDGQLNLGKFHTVADSIDLSLIHIRLKEISLGNTTAVLHFGKTVKSGRSIKEPAKPLTTDTASWAIDVARFALDGIHFRYDDDNAKPHPRGMDYSHLDLNGVQVKAEGVHVDSRTYEAKIRNIAATEKSGLALQKLSTEASYGDRGIVLKNLHIQTSRSEIKNNTVVRYASLESMKKNPGDITTDLVFDRSRIAVKDILIFVPSLEGPLKDNEQAVLSLNGKMTGKLKDLSIPYLELDGVGQTSLAASGRIRGLPDAAKAYYDIRIARFRTTRRDIFLFVSPASFPQSIRLPEGISAKGLFKGTARQFQTDFHLVTTKGSADLKGTLDLDRKAYNMQAVTRQIDLGYLLKQDTVLGKVSLEATARGSGFDPKKMNSDFHVRVREAVYKSYAYRGLLADAGVHDGNLKLTSSMQDSNLNYHLDAAGRFADKWPSLKLNVELDTLDALALHLAKDTLQMHLRAAADFSSTNPDALNGNLYIRDISVNTGTKAVHTDSVVLLAVHSDTAQLIQVRSEAADIDWQGRYKISQVSESLKQFFNKYYPIKGLGADTTEAANWQLKWVMRPSPIVLTLAPSVKGTDSLTGTLYFNSREKKFDLQAHAGKIQFGGQVIRNFNATTNSGKDSLSYRVSTASIGSPTMHLYNSAVFGALTQGKLLTTLQLKDNKSKDHYLVSGTLTNEKGGYHFVFNPDSLILNYQRWNITRENFVQYDSSGLLVRNLKLSHGTESLAIDSKGEATGSPLEIKFTTFRIKTITQFSGKDSLLLDGTVNGTAEIKDLTTHPLFTSDLKVDTLAYLKDTLGNLVLQVNNKELNAYVAHIALSGQKNDVLVDGKYYSGESKMDMNVKLNQLNLATFRGIASSQVKDMKGFLKGELHAVGNLDHPELNGELHFDSAVIVPYITGEPVRLSGDAIYFDNEGFNFADFAMQDSAGNKATLDGNVYTTDFKEYKFDLTFVANNFRVVNAPKEPNRVIYGRLTMNADVDVTGDSKLPKVEANFRINPKTDFYLILPSDDPEVVNRDGVVIFVDKNTKRDTARVRSFLDSLSSHARLTGMDLSVNIETDSNAQFTLIIDERNGDALAIRGRADLSGGVDKSGKVTLTGNYELDNGAYNLTLSLLHRRFDIQRGSTITWTGDPRRANIDISAIYTVKTPPLDLMQQQLSGKTGDDVNRYKQRLPFQVKLHMTGELLNPIIKFEINLPENLTALWPDVDLKLKQMATDEAEVNKQVFALLLLGRFVNENPFESSTPGADAGLIARQSASKILSDQLNQLAGSLVSGVDITFDMNSEQEYTTGTTQTQTDLNVQVSKGLFNDRVRVSVGSDFQLEDVNPGQNTTNIAGDVNVDYKLSKDGRYMIRVYRKDQYQTELQGQVVETGLSFILTFDYNKFKELFRGKKQEPPVVPVKRPKNKSTNTKTP